MLLMHGFTYMYKHSWAVTKTDIISNMHSSKPVILTLDFALKAAFFKTFAGNIPFCASIGTRKKNFLRHFLKHF